MQSLIHSVSDEKNKKSAGTFTKHTRRILNLPFIVSCFRPSLDKSFLIFASPLVLSLSSAWSVFHLLLSVYFWLLLFSFPLSFCLSPGIRLDLPLVGLAAVSSVPRALLIFIFSPVTPRPPPLAPSSPQSPSSPFVLLLPSISSSLWLTHECSSSHPSYFLTPSYILCLYLPFSSVILSTACLRSFLQMYRSVSCTPQWLRPFSCSLHLSKKAALL